jgi:hypothetical protein
MSPFLGELIGTALLILLGDGVVANVVLKNTKGNSGGWIVVTFGWAMAVFVGVLVSAAASGAHLNPAVTLGLAAAGKFEWARVPLYLYAQMLGAGNYSGGVTCAPNGAGVCGQDSRVTATVSMNFNTVVPNLLWMLPQPLVLQQTASMTFENW